MNEQKLTVDIDLMKKYDRAGPRYTSYPTAPYFHEGVDQQSYVDHIRSANEVNPDQDISLYFHLPFCDTLCYFCGCNMLLTRNSQQIDTYIDYLNKEMQLIRPHIGPNRRVAQLHWGGGTPTSLSAEQIRRLGQLIFQQFRPRPGAEISVEIDPRELTRDHMRVLRESGFNRCSLGVQDFDPKVQEAVNRIQPEEITRSAIDWARELEFESLNLDLMYGLPFQTPATYEKTLDKILEFDPDRLAVFNYAHLPKMIKHQRLIKDEWLPGPEEKLNLLKMSVEKLTEAGYVYIGMDHFAKPEDELTLAMQNGTLYRNFQGYSTHSGLDVFAFGMTGISILSDLYVQNFKKLKTYYHALDLGKLPVMRGVEVTEDDTLRREVITELMCNFRLVKADIETKYNIEFDQTFGDALANLEAFQEDGLVTLEKDAIRVSEMGRLLIRNIVMNFDAYLMKKTDQSPQFSRTV